MSLVIDKVREDSWIWLQTQSNVFTKPTSRFHLPFPSKSKVKDSAVLLIAMKKGLGLISTAGNRLRERSG